MNCPVARGHGQQGCVTPLNCPWKLQIGGNNPYISELWEMLLKIFTHSFSCHVSVRRQMFAFRVSPSAWPFHKAEIRIFQLCGKQVGVWGKQFNVWLYVELAKYFLQLVLPNSALVSVCKSFRNWSWFLQICLFSVKWFGWTIFSLWVTCTLSTSFVSCWQSVVSDLSPISHEVWASTG